MVKSFLFSLIMISFVINAENARWDNSIDINNPNLTIKVITQQCNKSLINAPDELEMWCEKTIDMGNWNALVPLSLHSGNGERLVKEATKRVKDKDPNAYATLAWIYATGMFIKQDIDYAISLYEDLLKLDVQLPEAQVSSTHNELATLYSVKQNWLAVVEHAQYVINMSQLEHDRDNAFRLLKVAQNKISLD
jgi:hypothetical protein